MSKKKKGEAVLQVTVCKEGCMNEPFFVPINGRAYLFCCQKGFEESLKQFAEHTAKQHQFRARNN